MRSCHLTVAEWPVWIGDDAVNITGGRLTIHTIASSRDETRAVGYLPHWQSLLILAIVFLGGLSSVGIELATSRLVAPYFGSSTFIWANLIGLTLTFLSIGYWIGGRVADRSPRPALLFTITAFASFFAGLIPVMSTEILSGALTAFDEVNVGAFYGSLIGVLLLLAVPVSLLGFVTPFAIRLRLNAISRAGNIAGNIYALSTVGSIAGSFLPVLVFIPLFGTRITFLILALSLLVPSIVGLMLVGAFGRTGLGVILVVVLVLLNWVNDVGAIRPADRGRLVYETESDSNYIQVLEQQGKTLLALNEGHAIHSIYDPSNLLTQGPWDYFMVGPLFNGPAATAVDRALVIGLAGGTTARQLTTAYGPIPIDGVEIDPEIARIGREYFGLDDSSLRNVNVIVNDGRYFLRTSSDRYDLIGVDAYRQPYIPFHLTTVEFFQEISDHLTTDGVAVINVGRTETDYRLVDVIASTMKSVFPSIYLIDTERYTNTIVIATKQPTDLENFGAAVRALAPDDIRRTVGERSIDTGNIREPVARADVFTDDHAPVELVVDQMIINAARSADDP